MSHRVFLIPETVSVLLSLGLVSGCASANRPTTTTDDVSGNRLVELVVRNETDVDLRVSAIWADLDRFPVNGRRLPQRTLGVFGAGQAGAFTLRHRARGISLKVEPWAGTRPDAVGSQPDAVASQPDGVVSGPIVEVSPGDRLQWVIMRIGVDLRVRLTARNNSGAPVSASSEAGLDPGLRF